MNETAFILNCLGNSHNEFFMDCGIFSSLDKALDYINDTESRYSSKLAFIYKITEWKIDGTIQHIWYKYPNKELELDLSFAQLLENLTYGK